MTIPKKHIPLVEGLLADTTQAVWYVRFGPRNPANFLGSPARVVLALLRNKILAQELKDSERPRIKMLDEQQHFSLLALASVAAMLQHYKKTRLITFEEMMRLANSLGCGRSISSDN